MSEPAPSVVLLAKFRAATSGTAGAMSIGTSKNGERRYRALLATKSVCGVVPSSLMSSVRIRFANGSLTYRMRRGAQLKIIPTRVAVFGAVDSAAAVVIRGMGLKEPASASG